MAKFTSAYFSVSSASRWLFLLQFLLECRIALGSLNLCVILGVYIRHLGILQRSHGITEEVCIVLRLLHEGLFLQLLHSLLMFLLSDILVVECLLK